MYTPVITSLCAPHVRGATVSRLLILVAALSASACFRLAPPPVVVHVDEDAHTGVALAAEDVRAFSEAMGRTVTLLEDEGLTDCVEGELHIVVLGADDESAFLPALDDAQAIALKEQRCGGKGSLVVTRGGSVLAAQWAAYDLLERFGVRFFHPEETYVPERLVMPDDPLDVALVPFLRWRTMNVHRTHPVELSPPDPIPEGLDMGVHQRRWIDWCVRNKHTAASGWDKEHVGNYAYDRGFPRQAGINLLNTQQGGRPVIDPDDPRPEEVQIEEAIVAALEPGEGEPPTTAFGFQFNPSEFTEANPFDTVRRLTFIADWFAQNRPEILLTTINHGTAGELVDGYGVRFFDLPMFAPTNLGVRVHTLMFYDVVREAPVYGNDDFRFLYTFMRREAANRRIIYYPESSWWLTFDLPVPLFLAPATLDARELDLAVLGDLASTSDDDVTGLYGHHLFTSGQEWGYWLIDWCTSRMTWTRGTRAFDCVSELTSLFDGGEIVRAVLLDVAKRQAVEMRDPEIIRYLVGSDDETETALLAGIDFHPLPLAPADVVSLSDDGVAALEAQSLAPLRAIRDAYAADAARLRAVIDRNPVHTKARLLREIVDGIEIYGLRAAHAVVVLETALALRAALAEGSLERVNTAAEGVDAARAITDAARLVVFAREGDYRYPDVLTIDGDEPGTPGAVPNQSIYPYRYLSRTHRMFYWTRPDDQLAALFGEGLEYVLPNRRVLVLGTVLDVGLVADTVDSLAVAWGDGASDATTTHTYDAQGHYAWTLDATLPTAAIHHEDDAFVVAERYAFRKSRLKVVEPRGAAAIEGLLPGAVIGLGTFAGDDVMLFGVVEETVDDTALVVAERGKIHLRGRTGLVSESGDLALDLRGVGQVTVKDAVLAVSLDDTRPDGALLDITGTLFTDDIIALLVSVGGFDEEGARSLVASLLEYTVDTLPPDIPFSLRADGFVTP
jgi:hypothetical protein